MTRSTTSSIALALWICCLPAGLSGCNNTNNPSETFAKSNKALSASNMPVAERKPFKRQPVPEPIDLLLPESINIHQFTGTRTFDEEGGIRGIDVRVEAFNAFREPTKAFGNFRFEIYTYKVNNPNRRGKLWGIWHVASMLEAKKNLQYWNRTQQMYEFRLQWDRPIPVGRKFILVGIFTSPFTERLTTERVFTSGQ